MYLYFLGTGAGIPAKHRNVSSLALFLPQYGGQVWLFDCGEATQHQILSSPVRLSKVSRIFITHLHGDHIFGLPGVLSSRSFQGIETPLTLYGPKGLKEFVHIFLHTSNSYLRYPLNIMEIKDGAVFADEHFQITVGLLEHNIPSYGYRLVEQDQPGSLDADRLLRLGIPPGPIYQQIKQGGNVPLPDGSVIDGQAFIGPAKKGSKITICGDTRPTPHTLLLAQQADLLVHEATLRAGEETQANAFFHSTTVQAAQLARDAGVKTLILNHISPRYFEEDSRKLLAEAQAIFPSTYLAADGYRFEIGRSQSRK
jgi:ribonuclease Z